MDTIRDLQTLRQLTGEASDTTRAKIQRRLTEQAQEFIRHCPLVLLSTATPSGASTISPKGDYPGFVHVQDEQTLLLPERKGNNLLFTLQNILDNPQVGLLFMVPRSKETLRVHGEAELSAAPELCRMLAAHNQPALLAIKIKVTESYFHCGKALIRSSLWKPDDWGEGVTISFAREMAANKRMDAQDIQQLDQNIANTYRNTPRSQR